MESEPEPSPAPPDQATIRPSSDPPQLLQTLWGMHVAAALFASTCFAPFSFALLPLIVLAHLSITGLLCSSLGSALHPQRLRFLAKVIFWDTVIPTPLFTILFALIGFGAGKSPEFLFIVPVATLVVGGAATLVASLSMLLAEFFSRKARVTLRVPAPGDRPAGGVQFTIKQLLALTAGAAVYLFLVRLIRESDGRDAMLGAIYLHQALGYGVIIPLVALWSTLTIGRTGFKITIGCLISVVGPVIPFAAFWPAEYNLSWEFAPLVILSICYSAMYFGSLLYVRSHGYRLVHADTRGPGTA